MNKDQIDGRKKELAGKIKEVAGKVVGDKQMQAKGKPVSHAHLRYLNPFPRNLGDIFSRFKRVLVPELNHGQLAILLRGRYGLSNVLTHNKVQGRPFTIREIAQKIESLL